MHDVHRGFFAVGICENYRVRLDCELNVDYEIIDKEKFDRVQKDYKRIQGSKYQAETFGINKSFHDVHILVDNMKANNPDVFKKKSTSKVFDDQGEFLQEVVVYENEVSEEIAAKRCELIAKWLDGYVMSSDYEKFLADECGMKVESYVLSYEEVKVSEEYIVDQHKKLYEGLKNIKDKITNEV